MNVKHTLSGLAAAAVLTIGVAESAAAETVVGGSARESAGPNIDGAGTERSSADADGATGRLTASAEAVGGRSLLGGVLGGIVPPVLPGTGASTAAASAGVERSFDVGPGIYEVTITLEGASAPVSTRGRGTADGYIQSSASYHGSAEPHIAFDDLSASASTVTRTFTVEVPADAHSLFVATDAVVIASANGTGNSGAVTAQVSRTTFSVERVG